MTTIETKRHIEINEGYQGINLTEFAIRVDQQISNEQVIDNFIRSKQFTYDSLHDCVKAEPENGFLRQAFNIEKIKIDDFKKTNNEGVIKFLITILNEPDWGDDRNDFSKLLNRYFEIHNNFGDSSFYILSMSWFDLEDERVLKPERLVYSYYFLIISIDRKINSLTLSEWSYD